MQFHGEEDKQIWNFKANIFSISSARNTIDLSFPPHGSIAWKWNCGARKDNILAWRIYLGRFPKKSILFILVSRSIVPATHEQRK